MVIINDAGVANPTPSPTVKVCLSRGVLCQRLVPLPSPAGYVSPGQASASGGGAFPQWADEAWDHVLQCYSGHRNAATVKGVSFFGAADEYVVSGSDCGHIYIWSKGSGQLRWWGKGDEEVVNCLEPHPGLPLTLATSGAVQAPCHGPR